MPKQGDLKVWHIPQVPIKPFKVPVKNIEEAILILDVLASYDDFQFKHHIKPDYCNVQGLIVYDENFDGEGHADWVEWYDDDGNDIQDVKEKIEDIKRTVKETSCPEGLDVRKSVEEAIYNKDRNLGN